VVVGGRNLKRLSQMEGCDYEAYVVGRTGNVMKRKKGVRGWESLAYVAPGISGIFQTSSTPLGEASEGVLNATEKIEKAADRGGEGGW